MQDRFVYRLATPDEWQTARETGDIQMTDLDRRDGFLHLSTAGQIIQSANLHFTTEPALWALLFARDELDAKLKWERVPGRWDEMPHYYGALAASQVRGAHEMTRNPGGSFGIITKGAL